MSKGQWFMISAVIATGAFLSISLIMKDFFIIDASTTSRDREDFFLWDLNEQFDRVVSQSPCADLDKNLDEFNTFSKRHLWESGYLIHIQYTKYSCSDQPKVREVGKGLVVATEDAVFYYNMSSADLNRIIPGI
jgi:hypothetical protein